MAGRRLISKALIFHGQLATIKNRSAPRRAPLSHRHDFRAHLVGRIGWVEALNPQRGARLRAIFDRIEW